MKDTLLSVLTNKGWMAIYDLHFDNAANLRVLGTSGCIAYDKVSQKIYSLQPIPSSESTIISTNLINNDNKKAGQLGVISVTSTEHLQRLNLATLVQKSEFIEDMKLPNMPTAIRNTEIQTYFKHDTEMANVEYVRDYEDGQVLADNEFILNSQDPSNYEETVQKVYARPIREFYETTPDSTDLLVDKTIIDEFFTNQAKFKDMLVAELGLVLLNLI